ncbi:MAG: L-aspartate oxidase, partial [Clostridiales bacterium]|nr:L-aspartate oxidase [Clostridiales bacterium]
MTEYDVVVVGSGAAGLYCALKLDKKLRVLIITKKKLRDCNSYLAQGGITTVVDENDKVSFIEDTIRAGKNENDVDAVRLLADEAKQMIADLVSLGMPFTTENGKIRYTKEGAHSRPRIVHADDETGRRLIETLEKHVRARENITVWEDATLIDVLEYSQEGMKSCAGVLLEKALTYQWIRCKKTVFACGGIGGLFKNTTNQSTVTGDALAIAHEHGIAVKDLAYIQFHPTALYEEGAGGRRFLISESLRGEGAQLLNPEKKLFIDPLLARDVVTAEIRKQMALHHSPHVYLDISDKDSAFIMKRFPAIYQKCLAAGYEITREPFPVMPSQHYFMGGIQVDLKGRTSMAHLYAIGEASCTGAHGKNRLASNSLLEALVYGAAAA